MRIIIYACMELPKKLKNHKNFDIFRCDRSKNAFFEGQTKNVGKSCDIKLWWSNNNQF